MKKNQYVGSFLPNIKQLLCLNIAIQWFYHFCPTPKSIHLSSIKLIWAVLCYKSRDIVEKIAVSCIPIISLQKNKATWSSRKVKSQTFLGVKRRKMLYINSWENMTQCSFKFMYSKCVCMENRLLYGRNRLLYSRKATQSWIRQIYPSLFTYVTAHMPINCSVFFSMDM